MRHAGRPSSLEFIFIVLRNFQLLQLYQYMNIDAPSAARTLIMEMLLTRTISGIRVMGIR